MNTSSRSSSSSSAAASSSSLFPGWQPVCQLVRESGRDDKDDSTATFIRAGPTTRGDSTDAGRRRTGTHSDATIHRTESDYLAVRLLKSLRVDPEQSASDDGWGGRRYSRTKDGGGGCDSSPPATNRSCVPGSFAVAAASTAAV